MTDGATVSVQQPREFELKPTAFAGQEYVCEGTFVRVHGWFFGRKKG